MSEVNAILKTKQKTASLNDLRNFRLNKNPNELLRTERVPGKKRIQMLADSDSDDISSPIKIQRRELTLKEKEERFLATVNLMPDYDTMVVQDALMHNNWNTTDAIKYLKEKCQKTYVRHHKSKSKSQSQSKYDCAADNDGDHKSSKKQVYDSEDSDNETATVMTSQRKNVFDFMNGATCIELQTVKSLTEKKANSIIELRPFRNWAELCSKLESNKLLSTDLLNNTQDLINKQNNVANILEKCNKMVKRLEAAIQTGAGINEQPKILNNNMKLADYQIIGLNWLTVMHMEKMNGILADEMGLGKTIQIIAFLAYLKEHNLVKGAHLIVVPSSTLDNWEHEINTWCPSLIVEKYYGTQDERRRMRIRFSKGGFSGFDILLTTYHIVSSTPEEKKMFRVCRLHYVIFDEAHMLKNMTTQRYMNLITINAEMRILLTGTPLQNNLIELMSLLCFVMPSVFSKNMDDIKSLFAKKGKADNTADYTSQSLFQDTQVERAKNIMKPFVLRRLKKDVLNNLPKKFSYIHKVPMSETQRTYYNDLVEYYSNNKGEICTRERAGISIMMEMRKIAQHPLLMRYYITDEQLRIISKRLSITTTYKKTNEQYIFEELAIMSDFQVWQLCQKHALYDITLPDKVICDSGKFQHLDKLLVQLKQDGHRVLIFSQFTTMLDIMERYLTIRHHGYYRLDGSTAVDERQDLINDFNQDSEIFIFLLSTKAGGIGINLTAADTCIIHDIDFNPYNDKQAEDRCHRMGQKKNVSIYRLISESTIEEGMLMVAEEKLKLEKDISSTEKNEVQEQKCVVRLLTMALGLDKDQEEELNNSINNSLTTIT